MKKNEILKLFNEDEVKDVINLYEKMSLAMEKDITMFGNGFYPPNIWKTFQDEISIKGYRIDTYGAFLNSERRMISFNNLFSYEYPMRIIVITNKSKFNKLSHKDYLGSIMSLGISREKIGDLVVKGDKCYIAVYEDILEYILMNLDRIGNTPCKVEEYCNDDITLIENDFKEEVILVQSLRIDNIVSKLTNKSRAFAQNLIIQGKVQKNYRVTRDKSLEINKEDRVTIRGYGKYIIGSVIGNSKSGKCKLIIKKYT